MVLTYADVQRIFRTEGNTPTLEEIPNDFYEQVSFLVSEVGAEHKNHITKLAGEIYTKRRNKIMLHALRFCDREKFPTNAIQCEKDFYIDAVEMLSKNSERILGNSMRKKHQEPEKTVEKKVKIRMLKPMPAIVGSDFNTYGPFKEDDVFELPETNAILLIRQNFAEEYVESPKAQEE